MGTPGEVHTATLLAETLPQLQAAQDIYRATPDAHFEEGWAVSCDLGRRGLAVLTHANPEKDAIIPVLLSPPERKVTRTAQLLAAPGRINLNDIETSMHALGLESSQMNDLWMLLLQRVVHFAEQKRFSSAQAQHVIAILGETALADLGPNPDLLELGARAERTQEGGTISAVFQRVPIPNKPRKHAWEYSFKDKEEDRMEVHVFKGRYSWLLEGDQAIEYRLGKVIHSDDERKVIEALPTPEQVDVAEAMYEGIDDAIENVTSGEWLYGRFKLFTDKADPRTVKTAILRTVQDGVKHDYVMSPNDLQHLGYPSKIQAKNKSFRSSFFEVVGTQLQGERFVHVCRVAGLSPKQIPEQFNGGSSISSYITRRLGKHSDVRIFLDNNTPSLYKPTLYEGDKATIPFLSPSSVPGNIKVNAAKLVNIFGNSIGGVIGAQNTRVVVGHEVYGNDEPEHRQELGLLIAALERDGYIIKTIRNKYEVFAPTGDLVLAGFEPRQPAIEINLLPECEPTERRVPNTDMPANAHRRRSSRPRHIS